MFGQVGELATSHAITEARVLQELRVRADRLLPHREPRRRCLRLCGQGPYNGGQAELLRVPYADWNALVLPDDARGKQNDYVMLSTSCPPAITARNSLRSASWRSGAPDRSG